MLGRRGLCYIAVVRRLQTFGVLVVLTACSHAQTNAVSDAYTLAYESLDARAQTMEDDACLNAVEVLWQLAYDKRDASAAESVVALLLDVDQLREALPHCRNAFR